MIDKDREIEIRREQLLEVEKWLVRTIKKDKDFLEREKKSRTFYYDDYDGYERTLEGGINALINAKKGVSKWRKKLKYELTRPLI